METQVHANADIFGFASHGGIANRRTSPETSTKRVASILGSHFTAHASRYCLVFAVHVNIPCV